MHRDEIVTMKRRSRPGGTPQASLSTNQEITTMSQTTSAELQLNALRDALERAAAAVAISEARASRAMSDLQVERGRSACAEQKLMDTATRLATAVDENRRLRDLIGSICKDRRMMERDVQEMIRNDAPRDPFTHEMREEPARANRQGHRAAA
jgi:hypothetical protein